MRRAGLILLLLVLCAAVPAWACGYADPDSALGAYFWTHIQHKTYWTGIGTNFYQYCLWHVDGCGVYQVGCWEIYKPF